MSEATSRAADLLVDIDGLDVSFASRQGQRSVVQGLSLQLHAGECVALVGESGSGKSVTARCLLGLAGVGAQVQARRFLVDGQDALGFDNRGWRALRGRFAGLVMQDALVSLDPLRSVGDEVGEVLWQHRLLGSPQERRDRVLDTLARVGLPDPAAQWPRHAHELSGGMRQRALIAAAAAARPRLIIADEPTTALDASIQKQVLDVLEGRVRDDGVGLLLISHDLSLVARLAHRVLVMRAGQVVEAGPTQQVLRAPAQAYTQQLIAAVPSAASRGHRLAGSRFEPAAPAPASAPAAGTAAATTPAPPRLVREPLPPRRPPGGAPVLRARGLGKHYAVPRRLWRQPVPAAAALVDVSFDIHAGEVLGLVGESGSGKTTCARLLLGLLEPDAGSVELLGQPWSGLAEAQRRALRPRLQYIPQDPLSSFDPRYRVRDILAENLPGLPAANLLQRCRSLLNQVGLDADTLGRAPRQLSGGQRQRVAIARALAAEPALIVCDEPVSALDVSVQAQVIDLIGELQARLGTALLFISHDINLVRHVADRVLVLHRGRIVEQGDVLAVLQRPQHAYTQALLNAVPEPLVA